MKLALPAREAEARGKRVADVEARARVQLVQLARERLLRDALKGRAQLARGRVAASGALALVMLAAIAGAFVLLLRLIGAYHRARAGD